MVLGRFRAKHKKQGKYWLPRRDAWSTEESQQVTQRRYITTIFGLASLKARGDLNFKGIKERADLRAKNKAAVTRDY